MPADVVGSEVVDEDPATGKKSFRFSAISIFSNVVLADEINRTPPKTQASLLEAMEERQVTVSGETRPLDAPFLYWPRKTQLNWREPIHCPRLNLTVSLIQ